MAVAMTAVMAIPLLQGRGVFNLVLIRFKFFMRRVSFIESNMLNTRLMQLMCVAHRYTGLQNNQYQHNVCQSTFKHFYSSSSLLVLKIVRYLNKSIRRAPLNTNNPIITPITRSGVWDPVTATRMPAEMTPALANTSFAENIQLALI